MNKYLITYLIGDFDVRGVDRIRVGMVVAEFGWPLSGVAARLQQGFECNGEWIMPGAILKITPCVNDKSKVEVSL